ncbi:hypothetical protein DFJ73DRAFT_917795 [Zopfochytrium polystomum]|nr:hypothetical protein DFJ73DRAFT_917795 [Zopfochytrium polystomum]
MEREAGHVAVLQWWKERGLAISFTPKAIVWASQFGHIGVLDWWKSERWPEFGHHVRRAFLRSAAKGNVQVLQWWQNNLSSDELQSMMMFIPKAAVFASQFRRIHVLEWLKTKGLLEFGPHVKTSENGHASALQLPKECGVTLRYSYDCIDRASGNGHVAVLQWWKDSGLELKFSNESMDFEDAMDRASANGHVGVLQWWKDSGLDLEYTIAAINHASSRGRTEVLQWWKDSGLELNYFSAALRLACENRQLEVLEWWNQSGLELRYDAGTVAAANVFIAEQPHRCWHLRRRLKQFRE